MRQVAALALLATGRAFVLPANAPRTTAVKADMLVDAPLDLVRSQHAQLIGQYLDDAVAELAPQALRQIQRRERRREVPGQALRRRRRGHVLRVAVRTPQVHGATAVIGLLILCGEV